MNTHFLPEIKVLRIIPINQGNLKALVNLQIGDITVRNFRLLTSEEGLKLLEPLEYWDTGQLFYPLVMVPEDLKDVALQAVLAEWSETQSYQCDEWEKPCQQIR